MLFMEARISALAQIFIELSSLAFLSFYIINPKKYSTRG